MIDKPDTTAQLDQFGVTRGFARSWLVQDSIEYSLNDLDPGTSEALLFQAMTVATRAMHGMQTKLMMVRAGFEGLRPVPPVTLQQGLSMVEHGGTHDDLRLLYSAHGFEYTLMVLGWMKTLGQERSEGGRGVPMLLEPGDIICHPTDEQWAVEVVAMEYGPERCVIWYTNADGGCFHPLEIGAYWPVRVLGWGY